MVGCVPRWERRDEMEGRCVGCSAKCTLDMEAEWGRVRGVEVSVLSAWV